MRTYKWVSMNVKKYNKVLETHGGTFLVDSNNRHIEVWEVTNLADASESFNESDGCSVQVYFFNHSATASSIHDALMSGTARPDHEDQIDDISAMWGIASHFIMGYAR